MRIVSTLLLTLVWKYSSASSHDTTLSLALKLKEWSSLQENGHFSAKQEIRNEVRTDPLSQIGIFATERIEEGEVLSRIPWTIIIDSAEDDDENDWDDEDEELASPNHSCSTFRKLLQEIKLGSNSKYMPYIDYLLARKQRLPVSQSKNGKKLFAEILGIQDETDYSFKQPQHLPLMDELIPRFLDYEWRTVCGSEDYDKELEDEEVLITAATLLTQFAHNELLIPTYDFYTHRNGDWLNTEVQAVYGEYYQIVARRTIEKGEQIHGSYNDCDDCSERDDYGTPEIFQNYGFVERMPQRWSLPGNAIYIDFKDDIENFLPPSFLYPYETAIVQNNDEELFWEFSDQDFMFYLDEADDDEGSHLEVTWELDIHPHTQEEITDFAPRLRKQVRRLKRMKNIEWDKDAASYDIPKEEWDSIWSFHESYVNALEAALDSLEMDGDDESDDSSHYDEFQQEVDRIVYNNLNCNSSELLDFRHYKSFDEKKSNYQVMNWQRPADDGDVCLHLDDMLQICSSYRPHYHEFFVHYPAQYIDKVRRVIYLGSGDAMLLHEILKYPDLELVVGLELDQDITRTSFRYFQTQPHFDDPRVEWWYGDATKTLPLLPRDYWGSFDLVLVDLSETVVSMDVTGQHDVIEVLAMLLKPEGILLENELYIDKLMDHFDHTIHIFYGSPKVCTQALTMSSNKVDFLHHPMKNHSVDTYLVKTPKEDMDRFIYIHDYIKTKPKCAIEEDNDNINNVVQGKTAGILEIVNLEETAVVLDSTLEQTIVSIVKKEGFKALSVPMPTRNNVAVVVMEEGYVVARSWPELKYCAIDIYLWGAFSKRGDLRQALSDALQSALVSNYRIVVGGMYGSKTLEQDKKEIGVNFSQNRNCEKSTNNRPSSTTIDDDTIKTIVEETVGIFSEVEVAAVVCGFENQEDCLVSQTLSQHPSVKQVFPIWTCPELETFDDSDSEEDYEAMHECEKKLEAVIQRFTTSSSHAFDVLIFDEKVAKPMVQIFDSLLSKPLHREQWLKKRHILASPFHKKASFKARFLAERYRKHTHKAVLSAGTIVFQAGDEFLAWVVVLVGDENYSLYHLSETEQRLKGRLPLLDVELRAVVGGLAHSKRDLEHEARTFGLDDYDSSAKAARLQYQQQRPLGRQSVFQLHWNDQEATFYKALLLLEQTLSEMGQGYKPDRFDTFANVGDGGVSTTVFKEGSAILVWDGRETVVINLFLFEQKKEKADFFLSTIELLSGHSLKVALRDDQPRGTGRVVNFECELKELKTVDDDSCPIVE